MKICKNIIKKAILDKQDIDTSLCRALLMYRNTEHTTTDESPAQMVQGRSLRTRLDCVKPDRAGAVRAAQRRQEAARGGAGRSVGLTALNTCGIGHTDLSKSGLRVG